MKLTLKIAKCPDATYAAWCPALPGCAVRAETRAEAQQRIQDAMTGYLSSLDVTLPRELGRRLGMEEAVPATA